MQMDTKQTLQQIAQRAAVRAWNAIAQCYGPAKLGDVPFVVMNRRLKATAGRAFLETGKIDLSYDLMLDFPRQFCMDTIPHECAHIAAYRLFCYGLQRGESHGEPWKQIMRNMGLPAKIYHDMLEQRAIKQMARRG